jgi:hypothetical protein
MGVHFVGFVSQYGYDRVLSVLGRHMRDFLNGGYSDLKIIHAPLIHCYIFIFAARYMY